MGVHSGAAEERDGDYFGPSLNRAARLMAAAHGGQVVVSDAAAQLSGWAGLVDLGEHRLKDLASPERVWQLGAGRHPPLRTLDPTRHNLPVPRGVLIGRVGQVEELSALVRGHRLVSVLGFGGPHASLLAAPRR